MTLKHSQIEKPLCIPDPYGNVTSDPEGESQDDVGGRQAAATVRSVVGSWGCLREEGRKGVVCESGERVNEEEAYSWGRRELMRTISGRETMGQTFAHTHRGVDTTLASQESN